jgi:hypothetical protein
MPKVKDVIQVHAVIPEKTAFLDVHTHGLEQYGHPNFAVYAPSIYVASATRLLDSLADAVLNKGEVFKPGENCQWDEWGKFHLEAGEDAGDFPVL